MSVPSRSFLVVPSVWLGVQVLCLSAVAASKARLAPYPATRSSDALVESPFRYLGPSGYPNTMAIRGDSVFIGGNFKGADGLASGALLLWNGKKWSEPFPGIDYGISGMKWSGDRLYVTGYFREAGGDSVDQAVYWEKGTWHGMGPGLPQYDFPGPIALLGDTVLTASRSGVFRWTGSGWVAFGQPLEGEPLRLENYGGTLWLTGKYATKTGQANLMRWDNGVWTTPAGTDPDKVIDIAWHGGALYMTKEKPVGVFVSYSTWRYDGKTWEDVTGVILGNYGRMASNGKDLYLTFHSFNVGIGMARWDGNTFQEIQFIPGDNGAGDIASFTASGKLILAGNFLGLGGRRMDYMGSWDGDTWSPLSATPTPDGISQYPTAIASDGKQLFVGGNPIHWAGSHMVSHMAAYNGAEWDTLGGGLQNPLDNRLVDVNVLTKGPGGMYAGGSFQATRYGPALNVARWDGSSWHALGEGFAGSVYAILSSGTDMVVGGRSDPAPSLGSGALPTGHAIGRWSGTTWNAYGAGLKGAVHDLAEFKGGLYAAGRFHIMPDGPECGLAKWDGLNWTAVPYAGTDTLPMDSVYALTVFKDRLYAMGRETKWEYPWDEALMAWDGATWERVENISQGTDMVTDGKGLYIQCDVFDDRRDLGFVKAARFDGSNWILLGADAAQSDIRSLALHGEYLYLGGWLSKIGGVPGCWLARWNIQTLVSVRPKRIVEARKGEKTVRYLLLGDAASAGTDLYGLDGRKFRSTEEPAKHRLRAGPVVEVK